MKISKAFVFGIVNANIAFLLFLFLHFGANQKKKDPAMIRDDQSTVNVSTQDETNDFCGRWVNPAGKNCERIIGLEVRMIDGAWMIRPVEENSNVILIQTWSHLNVDTSSGVGTASWTIGYPYMFLEITR